MRLGNGKIALILIALSLALAAAHWLQREPQSIAIREPSNVTDFERLILRDLRSYFQSSLAQKDLTIESEMLRLTAGSEALRYPRFYSWVTVKNRAGQILARGAVGLAALEQQEFEITDFLSVERIRQNEKSVRALFPASLYDSIVTHAHSK